MFFLYLGMFLAIVLLIGIILYLTRDLKQIKEEDSYIKNIDYEVNYYLQDKTLLEKVIKFYIKNKKLPVKISKQDFEPAYCDYLLEKTKDAIKTENYALAEKYYNIFRDFHPANPLNIARFIRMFYNMIDLDTAYNYIKEVLPIYGANKDFYEEIRDIMQKKATEHLSKFEEEHPEPDLEELIEEYNQLIEIYPNRVYHIKLADLYKEKEDLENARDNYLASLEIPQKPDKLYKGTHHKVAMIMFDLNQYKDSIYHLVEVLRIRPSHKSVSSDLSYICQNLGIQSYIPKLKDLYKEEGKEALFEYLEEIIDYSWIRNKE